MTKLFMQDHQNEGVHHFQRHAVWIVAIVYDCLVHRNDYNDAHQHEAYRKIMHKHWPDLVALTAVVRNIKVPIHHHQVRLEENIFIF